jgi:hypothetical protein
LPGEAGDEQVEAEFEALVALVSDQLVHHAGDVRELLRR